MTDFVDLLENDQQEKITKKGDDIHKFIEERRNTVSPFGIDELDEIVTGIHAHDYVCIGGQDKIGKSSIALFFTMQWIKQGKSVVYFTNEQSKECLKIRLASQLLGYNFANAMEGRLSEDEHSRLVAKTMEIESMPLTIIDTGEGTNSMTIKEKYLEHKPDIMIIDNLNQLKSKNTFQKRNELVKEFVEEVHTICKENPVCIIVISHLQREVAKHKYSWPTKDNLAESASIQREVDLVLLLAWPWLEQQSLPIELRKDTHKEDEYFVIVGANRNGPTGLASCAVDIRVGKFSSRRLLWKANTSQR